MRPILLSGQVRSGHGWFTLTIFWSFQWNWKKNEGRSSLVDWKEASEVWAAALKFGFFGHTGPDCLEKSHRHPDRASRSVHHFTSTKFSWAYSLCLNIESSENQEYHLFCLLHGHNLGVDNPFSETDRPHIIHYTFLAEINPQSWFGQLVKSSPNMSWKHPNICGPCISTVFHRHHIP